MLLGEQDGVTEGVGSSTAGEVWGLAPAVAGEVYAAVVLPPTALPGARLLFGLNPELIHLNNAAFGAVPLPVHREQRRLRDEADANPMRFFAHCLPDGIQRARRLMAEFLGSDPHGTALTFNVSTGIAAVLCALALSSDDEIVITNHNHPAVDLAVKREATRRGASVRLVRLALTPTDDDVCEAILRVLSPGRTRLVVIPQITFPTARLMPVARLADALHTVSVPVLADAAHAPGMLATPVSQVGADFWVGNMHKWAHAPRGTSVLVVSREWCERMEPLVVSAGRGGGFPASFDLPGGFDYTGWLAAPVGLEVLRGLGPDTVRRHNAELAVYGQNIVGTALAVEPDNLPAASPGVSMSLVPLPLGAATSEEGTAHLRWRIFEEMGAEVAIHIWEGVAYLRLSAQVYNTGEDYERLADRLPALISSSVRALTPTSER